MAHLPENATMSSEPTDSQSISISGSNLTNSPIAQAKGNINQSQQIGSGNSAEQLQLSDVVALLNQLKALLEESSLPEDQKQKAIRGVETAKDEAEAEKPDKEYAGKSLERATKVLKSANEVLGEGTSLWEKAAPIIKKVLPYFGIALGLLA